MGLFRLGKRKDERTASCCRSCSSNEAVQPANTCCTQAATGVSSIKVLGAGCKSCHEQLGYAKTAVSSLGLDMEVEYITDMEKIMSYGVMTMPAIVVNEQVACTGKVLKAAQVEELLKKFG